MAIDEETRAELAAIRQAIYPALKAWSIMADFQLIEAWDDAMLYQSWSTARGRSITFNQGDLRKALAGYKRLLKLSRKRR